MMVPKIVSHAASVIEQNKKDRIRVLSGEAHSKNKRHSPPASLSGSSTNLAETRLERRSRAAQSNRTQVYVAHFRKNHHGLLLGNWNILTLTGKEFKLVEKAKKYHLDIVGVSSTKKHGSAIKIFGWRLKAFLFRG